MYTGWASKTSEWVRGTDAFLEQAFGPAAKGSILMPCPCSTCKNKKWRLKDLVYRDLFKNGFVQNYTRQIHHGERDRIREEVVRPLLEEYDADTGMADMMADFHEGWFIEGMEVEEDLEETAKAFYTMMEAAQKPLHEKTMISQLDGISRLIALKSQLGISRDSFDFVLTVLGNLLPEDHILPKNTYESQRLLHALRCHTRRSKLVRMGASFSGETTRKQHTVQSAKPLGLWRSKAVMAPRRSNDTFLSHIGSNGCT
jgi:hypothetical protein